VGDIASFGFGSGAVCASEVIDVSTPNSRLGNVMGNNDIEGAEEVVDASGAENSRAGT
jgi:hypothetical protein